MKDEITNMLTDYGFKILRSSEKEAYVFATPTAVKELFSRKGWSKLSYSQFRKGNDYIEIAIANNSTRISLL